MATDPSYGGGLTYEASISKWRLTIHVDFDAFTNMPVLLGAVGQASYRIDASSAYSPNPLLSPDGKMTLVPDTKTFNQDAYVVIAQGYNGWLNPPKPVLLQYFIQVGLKNSQTIPPSLPPFSLEFHLEPSPTYTLDDLELCNIQAPGDPDDTSFPTSIRPDPTGQTVVFENLTKPGYYGLMMR